MTITLERRVDGTWIMWGDYNLSDLDSVKEMIKDIVMFEKIGQSVRVKEENEEAQDE